jgi:hypothetical protein
MIIEDDWLAGEHQAFPPQEVDKHQRATHKVFP